MNNNHLKLFKSLVKKHSLSIKPIAYELADDTPTFYFTAPQAVDFRSLVTELNQKLGAKSHLQQIGPRSCAKFQGGIGTCGRPFCCKQWLPSFPSVSVEIIRKQNLESELQQYLGPCGKPLCCLAYEAEDFKLKERKETPKKEPKESKNKTIGHIRPIETKEAKKQRSKEAPSYAKATEGRQKQRVVRRVLDLAKLKRKR